MTCHITNHAIVRYQQRVENLPADLVEKALDTPAIRKAINFGAPYVRLGTGQRVVIQKGIIVTVLPKQHAPGSMSPERDTRFACRESGRGANHG